MRRSCVLSTFRDPDVSNPCLEVNSDRYPDHSGIELRGWSRAGMGHGSSGSGRRRNAGDFADRWRGGDGRIGKLAERQQGHVILPQPKLRCM